MSCISGKYVYIILCLCGLSKFWLRILAANNEIVSYEIQISCKVRNFYGRRKNFFWKPDFHMIKILKKYIFLAAQTTMFLASHYLVMIKIWTFLRNLEKNGRFKKFCNLFKIFHLLFISIIIIIYFIYIHS